MRIRNSLFLAGAFGALASLVLVGNADASLKCRATMAKTVSKYVQGYSKILQKCEEAVLAGKIPAGPCPAADPKAGPAIAKLTGKTGPTLAKACCGADKTCGTADDPTGAFTHARCPDVEGPTADADPNCSDIVVQDVADLSACVSCVAGEEVVELNEVAFGGFAPASPGSDEAKCQIAIGKNTAAFFQAKSKLTATCRDGQLKGKITGTCDQDVKFVAGLAKAEEKKVVSICKACGGDDKLCGPNTCQNAGDTNGNGCTTNAGCNVCSNDQTACSNVPDCNACTAGNVGAPCDSTADCRICSAGNVGAPCELGNGACNMCTGGVNNGLPCPVGAFQCPGGTCGGGTCAAAIPNSCNGGALNTCGGGDCQGSDDIQLASIGFFPACPGITGGSDAPVQKLDDIVACVDQTASIRSDCADAIGASSQSQELPLGCEGTILACVGDQGPATIQVNVASTVGNLGALVVALGYKDANVAGSGDLDPITGPVQPTFFNGQVLVTDNQRQVVVSITAADPVGDPIPASGTPSLFFDADVSKCAGFLSADDVSCVVRDAADTTGAIVLEGVTCTVTVL